MFRSILLLLIFSISACGGGGGGGSVTTPAPEVVVEGGRVSSPATLDLTKKHVINIDPSTNYFSYTAQAGEKLIIQTSLSTPLTSDQLIGCSNSGGASNTSDYTSGNRKTDIIVYDLNINAIGGNCYGNLTYTFIQDGTYIIHFDFSINSNSGYFNVSSPSSSLSSGLGTPSTPSAISLSSSNTIKINPFYNYFSYTAQAGEKLIIQTSLSTPLTSDQLIGCSNSGGASNTSDYTSGNRKTDIIVYDLNINAIGGNCYGNLTYTFIQDGTYIIHFDFSINSNSGSFTIASII